jgi:hypothetical protein
MCPNVHDLHEPTTRPVEMADSALGGRPAAVRPFDGVAATLTELGQGA